MCLLFKNKPKNWVSCWYFCVILFGHSGCEFCHVPVFFFVLRIVTIVTIFTNQCSEFEIIIITVLNFGHLYKALEASQCLSKEMCYQKACVKDGQWAVWFSCLSQIPGYSLFFLISLTICPPYFPPFLFLHICLRTSILLQSLCFHEHTHTCCV